MTIKDQLSKAFEFFSNKTNKLLAEKPRTDILISYKDEIIGIAQELTFTFDGKLWLGRVRFPREKAVLIFKSAIINKATQIIPFDIILRLQNSPELILQGVTVERSGYTHSSTDWIIGDDIFLSLPQKVLLNDTPRI